MAGYLMSLDSADSLHLYASHGVYATKMGSPKGIWAGYHEGTFGDYATMRPDDNIYFFIKRKIYGIGKLVALAGDCKFQNFPDACVPQPVDYGSVKSQLLWDEGAFSADQRWLCTFRPDPHFFRAGVDMDDLLASNPTAFKMLRTFWKLTFTKFEDDENQAFRDLLIRQNQEFLDADPKDAEVFPANWQTEHQRIEALFEKHNYSLNLDPLLQTCAEGDRLRHEMAVEAGLLFQLSNRQPATASVFGTYDYLHHQVVASPFKPVDYIDKMDVFGYSYVPGFEPTKSRFLVGEVKKDEGLLQDLEQLMKYVDWVKEEYASGDYSMIRAFLVAYDFEAEAIERLHEVASRRYVIGRRPAVSREWKDLKLVRYRYDSSAKRLVFSVIS